MSTALIDELLKQRAAARDRQDFAAADAIRSSLTDLGVEVSDTPNGTRWSLHADFVGVRRADSAKRCRATASARAQCGVRAKAIQPVRAAECDEAWKAKALHPRQRTGRTTLPTGRRTRATHRPARAAAAKTGRPGSGPEWVVGRNAVLEAMEAEIPIRAAYVAEGAERDDRLRDILKLAATRGTALLEVTRGELDRLTGGALHQGVALQLPAFDVCPPRRPAGVCPRFRS